ncbi:MAG: IS5 family transposase [Candidatus Riflebacteria bacterium]|nr:IS5 family transposase [Candidatus Riflebacteria bacterium]
MPGKFTGLTQCQWDLLKGFLPPEPEMRWKGQPPAPFRPILNTIIYILITGCRWCDIPRGPKWGKRSTSHRWLGTWLSDGTLKRMKARLLGAAHLAGKIDWENASADGSFAAGKGGGEGVDHGFKGKGVTTHAIVDGNGRPLAVTSTGAAGSERDEVEPLLNGIIVDTGRKGRQRSRPKAIELDKGYDSKELREKNPETRNPTQNTSTTV